MRGVELGTYDSQTRSTSVTQQHLDDIGLTSLMGSLEREASVGTVDRDGEGVDLGRLKVRALNHANVIALKDVRSHNVLVGRAERASCLLRRNNQERRPNTTARTERSSATR